MDLKKITKKELIERIKDLEKELDNAHRKIKEYETFDVLGILTDEETVSGIGSFKIDLAETKLVKISIGYLKKAIKILETLDRNEIAIAIRSDFPLILGEFDKDKKTISGVVIAPRI